MRDHLASGLKWVAVATAVALIAGVLGFSLLARKNAAPPSQNAREVKAVDQIAPVQPTAQALRIDLDLREYVPSGKETKSQRRPFALPRRRLYVTIALPSGFGPGRTKFRWSMLNDGEERRHPDWRRFAMEVRCCRQRSISRFSLPARTSLLCAGKAKTGTCILHMCSSICVDGR